jgi:peptidoglycan-N-acetylglucosamine deacetylase
LTERLVTISVDDGHTTDLQTAELLSKYGLAATFYIPRRNAEREVLSQPKIRALAQQFEIGGHTLNHVSLNSVTERCAWREIREGKDWLEQVLGRRVVSFCYPRGKFNRHIVTMVRSAGFLGARTCRLNLHGFPRDPFICGLSTQAWCHSRTVQLRHAVLEGNFTGISNFVRVYKGATDWQKHFLHAIDYVDLHGGVAHLSLHSWEMDANDEWVKLELVLRGIAERKRFAPLTNGALFELWKVRHTQLSAIDSSPACPPYFS